MRWLAALVLASCVDTTTILTPVIDSPSNDEDAIVLNLDFITLAVAHEDAPADITQKTFSRANRSSSTACRSATTSSSI